MTKNNGTFIELFVCPCVVRDELTVFDKKLRKGDCPTEQPKMKVVRNCSVDTAPLQYLNCLVGFSSTHTYGVRQLLRIHDKLLGYRQPKVRQQDDPIAYIDRHVDYHHVLLLKRRPPMTTGE